MIVNRIGPHPVHDAVKRLRGMALEKCVCFPRAAHAVHNVISLLIFPDHFVTGVNIVLKVRIHGDHHIREIAGGHQTGQQRVLMPSVPAQTNARHMGIVIRQFTYGIPCAVFGAVVHKQNTALFIRVPLCNQGREFFRQPFAGLRQDFFLMIAGYNNI